MAEDSDVVWSYEPSRELPVVAATLYGMLFIFMFYLTVIKYRAWYFTCVLLGTAIEVVGYCMRVVSAKKPTELAPFVVTLIFVVLAPIFIAAGNYLLITRLIRIVLPPSRQNIYGIASRWLTKIFVICDIVGFFVQSAGSSIASSEDWVGRMGEIGTNVLIGGLCFQLCTIIVFLIFIRRFDYLARGQGYAIPEAPVGWQKLLTAIYISSSSIIVRSIFRVAEFAEGPKGYSFTHEWLFWLFETVPMLFAIAVFCVWHPSPCLGRGPSRHYSTKGSTQIKSRRSQISRTEDGLVEDLSGDRSY